MIRRENTREARKPASAKFDEKALGELARKYAAELGFPSEWQRIKRTYSVPELIYMVRASESKRGKGRPVSAKTLEWIARIRAEKQQGHGYLHLAAKFRPGLPKEQAQVELRKFRNRWKQQIDA